MVDIGTGFGKKVVAIITSMEEPLGNAIGNSLEVIEAIQTLKGNGPKDLEEVCITIASYMILLSNKAKTIEEARELAVLAIKRRSAVDKMREFISAQGGDNSVVDDTTKFGKAKYIYEVYSQKKGILSSIGAEDLGKIVCKLGGGRIAKDTVIDYQVGIVTNKKVGDKVDVGDCLATVHSNNKDIDIGERSS